MRTYLNTLAIVFIICLTGQKAYAQSQPVKYAYIQSELGKYLDVQWGSSKAGTLLHMWPFNGGDAQRWTLTKTGDSYFIKSSLGMFLDVQWGSTAAGTPVHTWTFNGGDAQKWKLIPAGDDYYYIQSELGNYLDVRWGHTASGTLVHTWPFNGGKAQRWRIHSAPDQNGISSTTAALSIKNKTKWNTNAICVCWENPEDGSTADRNLVKQAVAESWEKESDLSFYGWGKCNGNENGIRIKIADKVPHVKALGNRLAGMKNGMVLNFSFQKWCPNCRFNRTNSIKSNAIHEFGHAIGFSHEHNRRDCEFEGCDDAPQGTTGDYNITDCDAESIMNYCFNSSYNGELSALDIQGVRALYGFSGNNGRELRYFKPQSIRNICPVGAIEGDREFKGRGPRIHTSVTLQISQDQRHLEALIDFHALETGGGKNRSWTTGRWVKRLWTAAPTQRIVSIISDTYSEANFTSAASRDDKIIRCEPGKRAIPTITHGRAVKTMHVRGDTGGSDISRSSNCNCDTKIEYLEFNSVALMVENGFSADRKSLEDTNDHTTAKTTTMETDLTKDTTIQISFDPPIEPSISLGQNYPNPFSDRTFIEYSIDQTVKEANIQVINMMGRIIKTVPLTERGHGTIDLNLAELVPGTYTYTLMVDGQRVTQKRMIKHN